MVARTPPRQQQRRMKMVVPTPLSPTLLKETLNKVDKCMARLQELQYTVTGGTKVISGVSLSPRSTQGYIRASLKCKQESFRIRNANPRKSPGKLPTRTEEWRRMSLPAMLLGETVGEIIKASKFARDIVSAIDAPSKPKNHPKTPVTQERNHRLNADNSELRERRKREKQVVLRGIRSDLGTPTLQRAKSRINFKVSPVRNVVECHKENCKYIANRVSPRNRPWATKTVLFPNPLYHSTSSLSPTQKTKSPVNGRKQRAATTPHKFLIKSPKAAPAGTSKFQVKIRSPPKCISPKRLGKISPKAAFVPGGTTKLRRSFSPSRLASRLVSPLKGRKSAQFSPSRLANRLVSPLKGRKSAQMGDGAKMMMMMSGLKQRPNSSSMQL